MISLQAPDKPTPPPSAQACCRQSQCRSQPLASFQPGQPSDHLSTPTYLQGALCVPPFCSRMAVLFHPTILPPSHHPDPAHPSWPHPSTTLPPKPGPSRCWGG